MQYIKLEDTVFFFFGANDASGNGADGTGEAVSVREAGAATTAAPMPLAAAPATVDLLSDAGYTAGSYEIAIPVTSANLFSPDKTYAVFATLLVDAKNPTGHVGIFKIQGVPSSVVDMGASVLTSSAIATGAITSAKFAPGAIDAAAIATDAIDANALAADAVTKIQVGLSTFDEDIDEVNLKPTGLDNISIDTFSMPLALEIMAAGIAGQVSGVGTGTEIFLGLDASPAFTSTVDSSGNRTGISYP